jgi:hypothetical protein
MTPITGNDFLASVAERCERSRLLGRDAPWPLPKGLARRVSRQATALHATAFLASILHFPIPAKGRRLMSIAVSDAMN